MRLAWRDRETGKIVKRFSFGKPTPGYSEETHDLVRPKPKKPRK